MLPEDYELLGCDSFSNLENAFSNLWISQKHSELIPLAKPCSEIAKLLFSLEEQKEVSPFIYTMY